jgi:hypothetical protein
MVEHSPQSALPSAPGLSYSSLHFPLGWRLTHNTMSTPQLNNDAVAAARRALLERYLTDPTDHVWENVKEAMYREAEQHGFYGGFPITSVAREDLESLGFDVSAVTDDQMAEIADHMQDAYCDDPFWVELETIADDMDIPRKDDGCE